MLVFVPLAIVPLGCPPAPVTVTLHLAGGAAGPGAGFAVLASAGMVAAGAVLAAAGMAAAAGMVAAGTPLALAGGQARPAGEGPRVFA